MLTCWLSASVELLSEHKDLCQKKLSFRLTDLKEKIYIHWPNACKWGGIVDVSSSLKPSDPGWYGKWTVLWVEFCWSPKQQTCSGPRGLDPILEVLKLLPFRHRKLILWNQYLFHGRPKSTCQEQINNVIFQKGNLFSCHLCLWYRNLSDCLFQFCHPGIYLKP